MHSFDFEHLNEDQLMNVVKRVKRDKRIKRENDEWTSYLSHKKEKEFPLFVNFDNNLLEKDEDSHNLKITGIHLPTEITKVEDSVTREECVNNSYAQHPYKENSISDRHYSEKTRALVLKIRNLRHKLSMILDTLLLENEQVLLKEKLFKRTLNKFKETESWRKLMNCQYRILKLDYQLVMDLRKLSILATGDDIISLLKILYECHSTASKIFQVFAHGWPDLLEVDTSKEKLCDLLKCMRTLTRVCKFIGVNHSETIHFDDLVVDDINKRCKSILCAIKKRSSKEKLEKCRTNMKIHTEFNKNGCVCKTYQASTSIGLQNIPKNTIYVPMKKFKKLAKQVFSAKGRCEKHIERSALVLCKDCNSIRLPDSSKDKNKIEEKRKDQKSTHKIAKERCITSDVNSKEETKKDSSFNCVSVGTQHSSSFENKMEIFDIESFSKKLYAALEAEIHNNFHKFFRNLSVSQSYFKDCQTGGQNEGRPTFYHTNSIDSFFNELKDPFRTTEIEELSLEKENSRNLQRHMEVVELDIESSKQNVELRALTNEQDKYTEFKELHQKEEKRKSIVRDNHHLHIADESSSSEDEFLQENKANFAKHNFSSSNSPLVEHNKNNFSTLTGNNTACSDLAAMPWDIIGSISEKLIAECLTSISCEVDSFILQKMFDLEFN